MPATPTTTQEAASILAPYAPKSTAPTNFPSYPTTSTGGIGGPNLSGAPGMAGQGAFGLVPQVPNPLASAREAISGNVANLPGLTNLGTQTTTLNANLAQLPYQLNQPNYLTNLGLSAGNITSNLQGVIDPGTWEAIQQGAAERGARIGMGPGSPNFDTSWMRALGETAMQAEALGQQQLNAAITRTPTGIPFNAAGYQVGEPEVQSARYGANVAAAAPDPMQAAQANLDMLLQAIRAGQMGGLGGMGGMGGMGPRGGMAPLSPVSSTYPGFRMPFYGPTAPGAAYYVPQQPFYRTTAPGTTSEGQVSDIPQYWPEGMPGEQIGEIPQYWPEGMPGEYSGFSQYYDPIAAGEGYGTYYDPLEDYT